MESNQNTLNFENLSYNPFLNRNKILLNDNLDPDEHFYNDEMFEKINANYFSIETIQTKLKNLSANSSFSVLHLNIRSLNRNFENLKLFLHTCGYEFGIICLTETWCTNESFLANSNFQLPNYNAVHFGRENKKGGGVCI